jgi:hypothetical protein
VKPSLRFEVFKRDRFTCAYCGRSAPEVLLQVDHVIPISAGGLDNLDNLVTSCTDCNQGKGSRLLQEGSIGPSARSVEEIKERTKQLKQYRAWLQKYDEQVAGLVGLVYDEWYKAFGGEVKDGKRVCVWGWPQENSLRGFLKRIPVSDIVEAVWITRRKVSMGGGMHKGDAALRYFYAVCHGKIRDHEKGA